MAGSGSAASEFLRFLRRHRLALLLFCVAGGLGGLLVGVCGTPVYQATSSLEVRGLNNSFLDFGTLDPLAAGGSPSPTGLATETAILTSPGLIERTLAKLGFGRTAVEPNEESWLGGGGFTFGLAPGPGSSPRKRALATAADNLTVRVPGDTRILRLETESADPQVTADFLNTLADVYIEESLAARRADTGRTEEWLDGRLAEVRVKLLESEENLQHYARASGLLFLSPTENVSQQRLGQLQRELTRARADRVAKQSVFEMASVSVADSLPKILDDGPLRHYQVRLTELRRQHAELNATFTPAHHDVKRMAAQIDEVERAIEREQGAVIARVRNEYEAARRREDLLAQDYASQAGLVSEHAAKSIRYSILKREVDTNRELYDGLLKKVKETGLASALAASAVRVMDRARPPLQPSKPRPLLLTAMGLLAGLFAGMTLAWIRDSSDTRIRTPGDAAGCLCSPELGAIPSAAPAGWLAARTRPGRLRVRYAGGRSGSLRPRTSSVGNGAARTALPLERGVENAANSILGEGFRATLTSVLLASEPSRRRVFVVTSPSPSDGKTTVACNLAISLAQIHHKTLIVDADLHRPRLHAVFGVSNDWGLTNALNGSARISAASALAVIQDTSVSGLSVLPSGPVSQGVSTAVHRGRLPELLDALRSSFDMILFDTPPVMRIADARVVSRWADGVILVLRAGSTTTEEARAAEDRLRADGSRVLGTVLTRISNFSYLR